MLFWLVFIPFFGGLIGWLLEKGSYQSLAQIEQHTLKNNSRFSRLVNVFNKFCCSYSYWIVLFSMLISLVLTLVLCVDALVAFHQSKEWIEIVNMAWIPLFGIRFHLMLDGFSLLMILLTIIIAMIAIFYSRNELNHNSGLFYFCLSFMVSAILMLYVANDLFLFFFLWEAIVIPFYFLITLWRKKEVNISLKFNGASKFLIYTQVSSLLMLVAIIFLALTNWKLTNQWTFDYVILMKTPISSYVELLLMFGFLLAFVVRIPLIPFHNWFIDVHSETTTSGSIIVSGLFVNTSIYGLLRFVIPFFPNASLMITPVILILALLTLFYVILLCFNQNDVKRLIACIHIALMSFITTVIYSGELLAYQGVILQLISVSFVAIGLFIIGGQLIECYLTRNMNQYIGLKKHVNYLSTLTLFFILAVFGVPGTASFVGVFMMLLGEYTYSSYLCILLLIGLILLSVSIVIRFQPIFYSSTDKTLFNKKSISIRNVFLLVFILTLLFLIGLYPQWVFDMSYPAISKIQKIISDAKIDLLKGDV